MDDDFLTKCFENNVDATKLMLDIILPVKLTVHRVTTQATIKNLQGRSIRLDILAEDEAGGKGMRSSCSLTLPTRKPLTASSTGRTSRGIRRSISATDGTTSHLISPEKPIKRARKAVIRKHLLKLLYPQCVKRFLPLPRIAGL